MTMEDVVVSDCCGFDGPWMNVRIDEVWHLLMWNWPADAVTVHAQQPVRFCRGCGCALDKNTPVRKYHKGTVYLDRAVETAKQRVKANAKQG